MTDAAMIDDKPGEDQAELNRRKVADLAAFRARGDVILMNEYRLGLKIPPVDGPLSDPTGLSVGGNHISFSGAIIRDGDWDLMKPIEKYGPCDVPFFGDTFPVAEDVDHLYDRLSGNVAAQHDRLVKYYRAARIAYDEEKRQIYGTS